MRAEITDSKNNLKAKKGKEITIPDTEEDQALDEIVAYEAREELRQTKRLAAEKVRLRLVREINELKEKPAPARAEIATPVVEAKDEVIEYMHSNEYTHLTPDQQKNFIASVSEYKKMVNPNLNERLLSLISEGVKAQPTTTAPTTIIAQIREFFTAMDEVQKFRNPAPSIPVTVAEPAKNPIQERLMALFNTWLEKKLLGEDQPSPQFAQPQVPQSTKFQWDPVHGIYLPESMTYEQWKEMNEELYKRDKDKKDAESQKDREKMIMKNLGKPLLDRATPIFNAYAKKVEASITSPPPQKVRNSQAPASEPMTRMPAAPSPQSTLAPALAAQAQTQTVQEPAPTEGQTVPLNQDGSFNCTNTINGQPCNTNIKVIPDAQGNPPAEIICSKCGFIYRARRA